MRWVFTPGHTVSPMHPSIYFIVDMYYGRIDAMGDVIRWPPGARS